VDELFVRNERWITYLEHPTGARAAVVKVGATLVGRISVAYDPGIHSNDGTSSLRRRLYDPPRSLSKGAELGAFELGSTVVLLFAAGSADLRVSTGQVLEMGEAIGTLGAVQTHRTRKVRPRKGKGRPRARTKASPSKEEG